MRVLPKRLTLLQNFSLSENSAKHILMASVMSQGETAAVVPHGRVAPMCDGAASCAENGATFSSLLGWQLTLEPHPL